ncbi:MAG: FKBP-type peptidyl-prolyl cis-trans isomerase [Bacteroidaceae bacterium]|nr:FKBP-type peptidyl-prolyl cis-trans isomerase [Bacteroidaceae bacterium]
MHNSYFYFSLFTLSFFILSFSSCTSESEDYDQYHDWAKRNAAWFETVADSARTAINAAQAQYGDTWEQHCDWRMYKSLYKSQELQRGIVGDSICVHILNSGNGTVSPASNDTVRISFRGWLIPTTKADGTTEELVFSQSYYGNYDPRTAAPQKACVSSFTTGFATALQYMVEGDDWMVYIPQELFYGSNQTGLIPSYSSARFRIHMVGVYNVGEVVPPWN